MYACDTLVLRAGRFDFFYLPRSSGFSLMAVFQGLPGLGV